MPRLIFLENGAEAALCRGYVTVCVCVNITDLNGYAPRARQRGVVNHTSGHLALGRTYNTADFVLMHLKTHTHTHTLAHTQP